LYQQRLSAGLAAHEPLEAQRLQEALSDLYEGPLNDAAGALASVESLVQMFPDDTRLRRRSIHLLRRCGEAAREGAALADLEKLEQRLGMGPPRVEDLLRRAELLAGPLADEAGAIAAYEEVLRQRPGEQQALELLEQL